MRVNSKLLILLFFATLACGLSPSVNAAGTFVTSVPTSITVGAGFIIIKGQFQNPQGCGHPGWVLYERNDDPMAGITNDEMVALVTTAITMQRQVRFVELDCIFNLTWSGTSFVRIRAQAELF